MLTYLRRIWDQSRKNFADGFAGAAGSLCGTSAGGLPPRRALDLAELEDRLLMSASPVVAAAVAPDALIEQQALATIPAPETPDATADINDVARVALAHAPLSSDVSQYRAPTPVDAIGHWSLGLGHSRVLQLGDSTVIDAATNSAADVRHELLFVDTSVFNYQQLVDDVVAQGSGNRRFEFYLLDRHQDGVQQIADVLAGRSSLDAVHIVSHGSDGEVKLGNVWLSAANLDAYAGTIAAWGDALNDGADLLLYGCDLAGSEEGRTLAESLGALTGADVAASIDDTGSTLLGGDWDLEYASGEIQSSVVFSFDAQQNWFGLLSATPAGGTINVNQTPNADVQTTSNATPKAIASDANGNFIAVWESDKQDGSGWGVYARRFNNNGTANGGEFRVNQTTTGDQVNPAVAMNDSGAYVVVFQTDKAAGSVKQDIYAVLYNNLGGIVKAEFRVNSAYTTEDQTDPSVAMRNDGSFLVTWTSKDQDGDKEGIFGQIFDATGNAVGGVIQVNNVTPKEQLYSAVATNGSGEFIVTWSSKTLSDNKFTIQARRFDSSGTASGKEFTVDQYTGTDQLHSDVALADDGSFVVVWQSVGQDAGTAGIYARRYDAAGQAIGNEFRVNQSTATLNESAPSVASDASGNFVVTWTTDGMEVYSREFDALGNPTTTTDILVTSLAGSQFGGAVTLSANGDYIVVFSGTGPGDSNGVFAQRYDVPLLPAVDVNGAAAGVNFTAAFVEDGGAVNVVDNAAAVSDADSLQLQRLSVVLTNPLDGVAESLSADTTGTSLAAVYSNDVLTIQGAGPAALAEFTTVLRTVRYNNVSQAPTTTSRVLCFVASDTSHRHPGHVAGRQPIRRRCDVIG